MPERVRPQPTSTAASTRTPTSPSRAHAGPRSDVAGSGGRMEGARAGIAGAGGRSVKIDMRQASARALRIPWAQAGKSLRARPASPATGSGSRRLAERARGSFLALGVEHEDFDGLAVALGVDAAVEAPNDPAG